MSEPVTLAEAKAQTNMVNDNSQDTFLTSLLAPSRAYVERMSRYNFVAGEKTETFNRWDDYLEIMRRPIASITSVTYTDEAGNADTAYTGFLASIGDFSTRIYPAVDGSGFPALATGGLITVTYQADAVDSASEEYLLGKRAMLLLIGDWFENRENFVVGAISAGVQFALDRMLEALGPVSAY